MNQNTNKNALIVFLKYPEAGKVKTRLAKEIGQEKATEIYSLMAKVIIENVSVSKNYKTIIFYDPPDKELEVIDWIGKSDFVFMAQQGNTLGEKISNAFKEVFSQAADKVVIIGTDCTDVRSETINETIEYLGKVDIVLGPAVDGGYYLLGLNRYRPEIFQGINWSTNQVLDQTISIIKGKNLTFKQLELLRDIDTADDLKTNLTKTG